MGFGTLHLVEGSPPGNNVTVSKVYTTLCNGYLHWDHIKELKGICVKITNIVVTGAVAYNSGEGVTPTCFLLTHSGCVGLRKRARMPHEQNLPPRRPVHVGSITSPLHLATSTLKCLIMFVLFLTRGSLFISHALVH